MVTILVISPLTTTVSHIIGRSGRRPGVEEVAYNADNSFNLFRMVTRFFTNDLRGGGGGGSEWLPEGQYQGITDGDERCLR